MPKEDGLVPDVQSRARGAVYNWKQLSNDQSVAYYKARHREGIELNRARGTHRAAVSQVGIILLPRPGKLKRCRNTRW